jgi:hypothetical protein
VGQQALIGQDHQRLADRDAADAELEGELLLTKLIAG